MNKPASSKATLALELFHQGYNCSQAVFTAFSEECGLDREAALRMASPFGAGIGRMREVCGAFCGAAMVLGTHQGNDSPDQDSKERIFTLVQDMADKFKREFGTIHCRELLHMTADSPQEPPRPSERTEAYYNSRPCEQCVAKCAEWAEEYLK